MKKNSYVKSDPKVSRLDFFWGFCDYTGNTPFIHCCEAVV